VTMVTAALAPAFTAILEAPENLSAAYEAVIVALRALTPALPPPAALNARSPRSECLVHAWYCFFGSKIR